ncbi:hypothetical protein [Ciceribacter selenitireducens]|jgi:hypothetical protein|nr:hypothetical protein [Ciceribacter selenitireducens]
MSYIPYNSSRQSRTVNPARPDLRKALPAGALIASFFFIAGLLVFL